MTEMEKNFKDLEELYKLGMLDAEGYAWQKKQLEDAMARESGQAASTPNQQTATPVVTLASQSGHSEDAETLFQKGKAAYDHNDFAEAFTCYSKAAAQGHAKAQYSLSFCYDGGEGVPQDKAKGIYWLTKAAENEYDEAQYMLGFYYSRGSKGVQQDYAKAAEWYRKATAQGHANAQSRLDFLKKQGLI